MKKVHVLFRTSTRCVAGMLSSVFCALMAGALLRHLSANSSKADEVQIQGKHQKSRSPGKVIADH